MSCMIRGKYDQVLQISFFRIQKQFLTIDVDTLDDVASVTVDNILTPTAAPPYTRN